MKGKRKKVVHMELATPPPLSMRATWLRHAGRERTMGR